MALLLA
ncbi:putative lipoprotein, partial [Vibrio cholerae HC-17A1]